MADISAFKPYGAGGASYNIKDATARSNISGLDTRVTALENAGGGQKTYFAGVYGTDPEGDYGFTDCDCTIIVDATRWIYDDDDQQIQKTFHDTYSYYNTIADELQRVGTPKVGDIIFVKDGNILSIAGTLPSDTTIGYLSDTSGLDGRYVQKAAPEPVPPYGFPIVGSGNYVSIGTAWYSSYKAFYIVGLATVTVPSEEVEGKTDTLLIAKCFGTEG